MLSGSSAHPWGHYMARARCTACGKFLCWERRKEHQDTCLPGYTRQRKGWKKRARFQLDEDRHLVLGMLFADGNYKQLVFVCPVCGKAHNVDWDKPNKQRQQRTRSRTHRCQGVLYDYDVDPTLPIGEIYGRD